MKVLYTKHFNPLQDNKILALSKLKALADNNFIVAQIVQFFSEGVQSIEGKGKNAAFKHFLLFPLSFQNSYFYRVVKTHGCLGKG